MSFTTRMAIEVSGKRTEDLRTCAVSSEGNRFQRGISKIKLAKQQDLPTDWKLFEPQELSDRRRTKLR